MADNSISIAGNLTKDPELRFLTNGSAKASVSVACNRRYQVNGEWKEEVTYFDVIAWRKLAENLCASFKKGDRIMINGRMISRSYEASDGSGTRKVWEIDAEDIGGSVKYATADITRNPREDGGNYSPRQNAPAASAAPASDDPFAADEPF